MRPKTTIIITGKPGTGKTELARTIANVFDKDEVVYRPSCHPLEFSFLPEKTKCIIVDGITLCKKRIERIKLFSTSVEIYAEEQGKKKKLIPRPLLIVTAQNKAPLSHHYTIIRLKPLK